MDLADKTASWQYLANGWLQRQTLGDGAKSIYVHNALGQLTALTNALSDDTVLSSYTGIAYNGEGSRTSVTVNLPSLMRAAYNHSNIMRYLEEAIAETYATRYLLHGLSFPIANGYVTGGGLLLEGVVLGGSGYLLYQTSR